MLGFPQHLYLINYYHRQFLHLQVLAENIVFKATLQNAIDYARIQGTTEISVPLLTQRYQHSVNSAATS